MPVTVHPCNGPIRTSYSRPQISRVAAVFRRNPMKKMFKKTGRVLQSSFPKPSQDSSNSDLIMKAMNYNGFVDSVLCAVHGQHHLVIRPDDVWMTILAQFNFFARANAKQLQHFYVDHEGKHKLTVTSVGTQDNFGDMAKQLAKLIQENTVGPSLREWILPEFTTTTPNDLIISSIIMMMTTFQESFIYRHTKRHGFPAVTLLGEKEDWEKIQERIEKFKEYGEETTQWYGLLKPVLTGFVRSFDQPEDRSIKDFWLEMASLIRGGCRPSFITGWITAFCFFSASGESLYQMYWDYRGSKRASDGVKYHQVNLGRIPSTYAKVHVALNVNGVECKAVKTAGLLGMRTSGKKKGTFQPQSAWCIAEELKEK